MSHTPGPWEVGYSGGVTGPTAAPLVHLDQEPHDVISARDGKYARVVCAVFNPADDQQQANARLIAAAPELLVAVKELRLLVDGEGGMPEGVRSRADAAIAKATGGAR